ncbi:MAG: carboxypeptidase-like regulatory domain-containing protein, partial [Bryobacteraceae bacterium]|nr:carboxypeptidase-like regulatory domain-containing protein [Bryobacteraceae bacterium]
MMTWARFVSLSLLVCVGLFAQATGRLTGVIQDASGAKVPGATVSLYLSGGNAPLLTAKTSSEGVFDFVTLRPALYDVHVEAAGFAKSVSGGIKVDPARETALPAISLQVASASQTIEVSESPLAVQTTNFEVATTVTQKQVEQLPILDRQIGNLFSLQAGVGSNNLTATVINGLRPSYSALTLDGINVQDNWVRTNGLDFLPNRLTIGQVAEMTVSTSNSNASLGGGANQISMVTPSGTNAIHGSLYWFNRNNAAAANDWFNNQTGVEKPRLNLNQFGGTVGGPIKKDKLFYYANYESYRRRSQTPILNTVLTPTARQGILRYRLADGSVQSFNVLTTRQVTPSPLVARLLQDVPVNGNSNQAGDGLNTIGYNFNARSNIDRDFITGKGDYYLNAKNSFSSSYIWNRDRVDRPTLGTFYTVTPPTINDNSAHFWTVAWRSTLSASLTNELRGGFNRTKSPFVTSNPVPDLLLAGLLYTSPLNTKLPEGRDTSTYVIQDNANWIRGKHSLSFGYQGQYVRVPVYDYAGTVPTYTLG